MNNSTVQGSFIFFGSSAMSALTLEYLLSLGIKPALIITSIDKPKGRKLILTPPEPKQFAEKHGIPYFQFKSIKGVNLAHTCDTLKTFIDSHNTNNPSQPITFSLVASYGYIIPKEILDIPIYGTLNLHPSLLPKYRGATPIQQAILDDDKNTGVTIMKLDEEMDHGNILYQKTLSQIIDGTISHQTEVGIVKKRPESLWPMTYSQLENILVRAGCELITLHIQDISNGLAIEQIQDHSKATYTQKIIKEHGLISIQKLDNQEGYQTYLSYLAYEIWPGTFFFVDTDKKPNMRVKVASAHWDTNNHKMIIDSVVPEGQKETSWTEFKKKIIDNGKPMH